MYILGWIIYQIGIAAHLLLLLYVIRIKRITKVAQRFQWWLLLFFFSTIVLLFRTGVRQWRGRSRTYYRAVVIRWEKHLRNSVWQEMCELENPFRKLGSCLFIYYIYAQLHKSFPVWLYTIIPIPCTMYNTYLLHICKKTNAKINSSAFCQKRFREIHALIVLYACSNVLFF